MLSIPISKLLLYLTFFSWCISLGGCSTATNTSDIEIEHERISEEEEASPISSNMQVENEETTENINNSTSTIIATLQALMKTLQEDQERFEAETSDDLSQIRNQLSELEEKFNSYSKSANNSGSDDKEIDDIAKGKGSPEAMGPNQSDLHNQTLHKIREMHQTHENEIKQIKGAHDSLKSTLQTVHNRLEHLSGMHNITERLMHTAELLVQERWYEATLHWTFAENHVRHDPGLDVNKIMSDHLRSVISYAYLSNENIVDDDDMRHSRAQTHIRASRLIPIFQFVHKLSYKEYKVFAYETLIEQLLTDDIFDGWEIFVLSHYVRIHYGSNSKGQRLLPKLAQIVTSGSSVKLEYLQFLESNNSDSSTSGPQNDPEPTNTTLSSENAFEYEYDENEDPSSAAEMSRQSGRLQYRKNVTFDLHTKYDTVTHKRRDSFKSFGFPVYGSKANTYTPPYSGTWAIEYQKNGYFVIKNQANEGFLNLPRVPARPSPLNLNTVPDLDNDRNNVEFQIIFLTNSTFGIQATVFGRRGAVVVGECDPQFQRVTGTGTGQGQNENRSVCFQVKDSNVADTRKDWNAAEFTVSRFTRI